MLILQFGAKAMNTEWSFRGSSCTVPVFPQTAMPSIRALRPVPLGWSTMLVHHTDKSTPAATPRT